MIAALVLAAGRSLRMGRPKMLLPWGQTTVIGKVISTLLEANMNDICVVSGGNRNEVEAALSSFKVEYVYNPDYENGEMLSSVQAGLLHLAEKVQAAMIVLGDQPQVEVEVIRAILESYLATHSKIIVPSFQMHRGHPWLIDMELWGEINDLKPPQTLRDYLIQKSEVITYVNVDTSSILQDLDTPVDYQKLKP